MLAVSGKLDLTMGGPGFELFRFKDDHSPIYDHTAVDKINDPANWRRTVYRFTVRSVPNPFLECLDCADPNVNTPVRNTTLTALQALALLNDPFMLKQAECFAERLREGQRRPAEAGGRGVPAGVRPAADGGGARRPGGVCAETWAGEGVPGAVQCQRVRVHRLTPGGGEDAWLASRRKRRKTRLPDLGRQAHGGDRLAPRPDDGPHPNVQRLLRGGPDGRTCSGNLLVFYEPGNRAAASIP